MPLNYSQSFRTAASTEHIPTTGTIDESHSKLRRHEPRCNTPPRSPSRQEQVSTTPPGSPFEGRLSSGETRQELIERKKREQRAQWLPNSHSTLAAGTRAGVDFISSGPRSILPPAELDKDSPTDSPSRTFNRLEAGSNIERPRSALHRGDFRKEKDELQPGSPYPRQSIGLQQDQWANAYQTSPRQQPRVPAVPSLPKHETFGGFELQQQSKPSLYRPRAASYNARSLSFGLQPPTSPLVNATNNSDSDNEHERLGRLQSPSKASRRRTFSPGALRSLRPTGGSHGSSTTVPRALPNVRRDPAFPYQAHQPRRSLNPSSEPFAFSKPQSPSARSRRPSLASESSPLQRAPMVGRYEESILRGRMSTLPSRPLDFVAQIGVLGKGVCKTSLRCPPHVTVPFPAVFYNYGSRPSSPNKANDGPSPYVGMIDLDSLKPPADPVHPKSSVMQSTKAKLSNNAAPIDVHRPSQVTKRSAPPHEKKWSSRAPTGGYRIPEKGQLQIILKNPNKTAVKLFLIPYDLEGMQQGQKTFIRQRSYSAGPIIDMPSTMRKNLGTNIPEASLTNSEDPKERPTLRYLIHLNICCPSKGRYFLYKSIRVVFANRVPDGKDSLRQEIQLPDPRYSPWKPDQDVARAPDHRMTLPSQMSYKNTFAQRDVRSSGLDRMDGLVPEAGSVDDDNTSRAFTFPTHHPIPLIPREQPVQPRDYMEDVHMQTPPLPTPEHTCRACPRIRKELSKPFTFERLSRDEYGEGATNRRPHSPVPGEGMIGFHLRDRTGSRPSSRGY